MRLRARRMISKSSPACFNCHKRPAASFLLVKRSWRLIYRLPALGIAAIQARVAAVHHDDGSGAALRAELRAFGKMRFRKSVGLLGSRLELRALFLHELALMHVELGLLEHSDRLQVPLDHIAELGDGRG